jgi:hypothetical protein
LTLSAVGLVPDPAGPHVAALGAAALAGCLCATLAYRRNSC